MDFDKTLQKLSEQVNQFSGIKNNNTTLYASQTTSLPLILGDKKYYYYLGVPIAFLVILYLCKPGFVMEEISVNGDIPTKKISIKKLFISSIVLSIILIVAILFINVYKGKSS